MAITVQNIAPDAVVLFEIHVENFSDRIPKDLHRWAGDVMLNEGRKD
jgi:hypothetical protein